MPRRSESSRPRQRILELLKRGGPQDARSLAAQLGVSAMAVRQQLYALRSARLATFTEESRRLGRPAKIWKLTAAAERYFPDAHAVLAVDLVASLVETFGGSGLERLVKARAGKQIEDYSRQVPRGGSLGRRMRRLAELRTAEGYMAEIIEDAGGTYLFVENHCPICAAASACNGLCAAELEVFQQVLGNDVTVERQEHILAGARRCVYRVSPRRAPGSNNRKPSSPVE